MAYEKDKPASSTSLRASNPIILSNQAAIELALNREHTFSTGGGETEQAQHRQGSARCFFQDSEPTTQVDGGAFASTDLGSLWFDTNSSPVNKYSVLTATTPTWTPVSDEVIAVLLAANRVFAGTLGVTGNFAVNADKMTVDAATGNTLVAGTFDASTSLDIAGTVVVVGTIDDDTMATATDTTIATAESIVAYVGAIQTVNTQTGNLSSGTGTIPNDDTIPQSNEGDAFMNLAITPISATNKLKIDVVFHYANTNNGRQTVALFQDSIADALAASAGIVVAANLNSIATLSFSHFMTAGTTSEINFQVRAGGTGGTMTFNGEGGSREMGGVAASSITITELKP